MAQAAAIGETGVFALRTQLFGGAEGFPPSLETRIITRQSFSSLFFWQ